MIVKNTIRIAFGIMVLMLVANVALAAYPWWDDSRSFRYTVTVDANGYERIDKPVDVNINFTKLIKGIGKTGTLDENSIRIVEISSIGTILNTDVQYQFDKASDYDPDNNAAGTIIFIMDGTTTSSKTRYYHIYFGLTGPSYSSLIVPPLVTWNENVDEGMSSYQINTENGKYYFQKNAGGFSSLVDKSSNDWIGWNNIHGFGGTWRGIPNAIYGKEIFHPGFNCCISTIVSQGPIKVRIRSTNETKWESIWDFYPKYATMIMTKVDGNYWMLYEGAPGGTMEPNKDFMVRYNNVQTPLSQSWSGDIPNNEWVYFSDPDVERSLFLSHHNDDTLKDSYFPGLNVNGNMTVFGFGRYMSESYLSSVPQKFTIGLIDSISYTQNAKEINSAYKDLAITAGGIEQKGGNDNSSVQFQQITSDGNKNRQPSWSPDANWLTFMTRDSGWKIAKINLNDLSTTTLPGGDGGIEPVWSPDGNKIAFSRGTSDALMDVYVMNTDGNDVKKLTPTYGYDEYPDWSPDGTKIAYVSQLGDASNAKYIAVMNADGSGNHSLNVQGIQPSWSPDGTKIAFKCYPDNEICVVNSNGGGFKKLTNNGVNSHEPDWSPDGRYIVYASVKDGDWEIYRIDADGSNEIKLTSNSGIEDNYPVWSPDGTKIAFSRNSSGSENIWIMSFGSVDPTLSIISSYPDTNPVTSYGASQSFRIGLNMNADVAWYLDDNIVNSESNVLNSAYDSTSDVNIGTHGVRVVVTNGTKTASKEWVWTVTDNSPVAYIPPSPILTNNTGNFWVNHTWRPGTVISGRTNKTDSYNTSIDNGLTWNNGSVDRYLNISDVGPHGYSNITIYAYNNSGGGSLSDNNVTESTQIPNNAPVLNTIGNKEILVGNTLGFTVLAADLDSDNIKYDTNATKGEFNKLTGAYSWIPTNGDVGSYKWTFNSSDDYGGIDEETIIVTVNNVSNVSSVKVNITEPVQGQSIRFLDNIVKGNVSSSDINSLVLNIKYGNITRSYDVKSKLIGNKFSQRVEYIPDKNNVLELIVVDNTGSSANTSITVNVGNNTYENSTGVNIGEEVTIDAINEADTELKLFSNISGLLRFKLVGITNTTEINSLNGTTSGEIALGKIVDINIYDNGSNVSNNVSNIDNVTIKQYYTNKDLDLNGDGSINNGELDEDKIYYYWYNTSSNNWNKLQKGNPEWVIDLGTQKITGNNKGYAWIKVRHLSKFGMTAGLKTSSTDTGGNNGGGSSGSSGGGGGGGGGGSAEKYDNIELKERREADIYKDTDTSYLFTDPKNAIKYINITGNTNAGDISIIVEMLKGKSSLLKTSAPGFVYRNINIWVGSGGFSDAKNIKSSSITFKVENSWLDRSANKGNVVLVRWDGNDWTKLDAVENGKDANYTYYISSTNGFKHFAITKMRNNITTESPDEQPISTKKDDKSMVEMQDPNITSSSVPNKDVPGFGIILGIVAMIVVMVTHRIRKK